jgi:hypothetical protein
LVVIKGCRLAAESSGTSARRMRPSGAATLDLDGTEDEHFGVMASAAPAAAGKGIILAAARDLGLVEVCLPQAAPSQVHGLVGTSQALVLPQPER